MLEDNSSHNAEKNDTHTLIIQDARVKTMSEIIEKHMRLKWEEQPKCSSCNTVISSTDC